MKWKFNFSFFLNLNVLILKIYFLFFIFQDINFDSPRGGVSLVTEKGEVTSSRLMIQNAVPNDSGLYTCKPSNANPTSIKVHVVKGNLIASHILYYIIHHIPMKYVKTFFHCFFFFFHFFL